MLGAYRCPTRIPSIRKMLYAGYPEVRRKADYKLRPRLPGRIQSCYSITATPYKAETLQILENAYEPRRRRSNVTSQYHEDPIGMVGYRRVIYWRLQLMYSEQKQHRCRTITTVCKSELITGGAQGA